MSSTARTPRRKFRDTRQLIRIALEAGMTQTEIAKLCRTTQSTVSGWASGKAKAYEHQIEALVEKYGRSLERRRESYYYVDGPSDEEWAQTEEGRAFEREVEALKDLQALSVGEEVDDRVVLEQVTKLIATLGIGPGELEQFNRRFASLAAVRNWRRSRDRNVAVVEGANIFRHSMREMVDLVTFGESSQPRWRSVARWIVHDLAGAFALVVQRRMEVPARPDVQVFNRRGGGENGHKVPMQVFCEDQGAEWLSTIEGPLSLQDLLARADHFARDPNWRHLPDDQATLPLRLRRALAEAGFPVPGLRRIGPS